MQIILIEKAFQMAYVSKQKTRTNVPLNDPKIGNWNNRPPLHDRKTVHLGQVL